MPARRQSQSQRSKPSAAAAARRRPGDAAVAGGGAAGAAVGAAAAAAGAAVGAAAFAFSFVAFALACLALFANSVLVGSAARAFAALSAFCFLRTAPGDIAARSSSGISSSVTRALRFLPRPPAGTAADTGARAQGGEQWRAHSGLPSPPHCQKIGLHGGF